MTTFAGQRVLVTGAAGFIGSHLTEALVTEGAEVRALVHYNARNDIGNLEFLAPEVLEAVEVLAGEVQDPFSMTSAVKDREVVFHLAALIGIPYSYLAPKSYVDTNVSGTLNVLQACRGADGVRLVHTSTSETYGTAMYTPIDEAHPLQGQSPYSASKIGADKLAEAYARSFDVSVATLRPFNTFGPRQSLRAVIPTIITQALAGEAVKLGSISPVRDFTYVGDTVRAFLSVATGPPERVCGQVFNAGNGKGITVGDVARLVLKLLRSEAPLLADENRMRPESSEVFELIADSAKLRQLTGWEPQTTLREGLVETIEFLRSRRGLENVRAKYIV